MKYLRNVSAAIAIAGALAAASPARSAPMSQDATFSMKFAEAGASEMALAHIALAKSKNAAVGRFAQKMIADHTKAGDKLEVIAQPLGYTTPMTPDAMGAAAKQKLTNAGSDFDATYRTANIMGHKAAIALLQSEIAAGKNPKLVAYARMTLPTVETHLNLAMALPTT